MANTRTNLQQANINRSMKTITELVQKIMQTFQMHNQKANTRTNLQKQRHKKQSENSICSSYKSFKVQIPTTKGFSTVKIFENRKFICLTLKASVYQQLAASKQKSSHRLNVFFYSLMMHSKLVDCTLRASMV